MKHPVIIIFCCAVAATPLFAAERGDTINVSGLRAFWDQPSGSLAFIPNALSYNAARRAVVFRVLKTGSAYELPDSRVLWFRVNHRSEGDEGASFLGVQIIKFFDDVVTVQTPVYLFRKGDWFRQGRPLPDEIVKRSRATVETFSAGHSEEANLAALDELLGTQWHAALRSGPLDSWEERYFWRLTDVLAAPSLQSRFVEALPTNYRVSADCRLLEFKATLDTRNLQPLIFQVTPGEARAMILRTYCPNREVFDNTIYVTFE